jgi:hypothetical protein
MAHLKTLETQRRPARRLEWKLRIVRGLYERGYSRKDVLELFRCIDWFMHLPPAQGRAFEQALHALETEKKMPYITSIERSGYQRGREESRREALREAIMELLDARLGPVPDEVLDQLGRVGEGSRLRTLLRQAAAAGSLEEFRAGLP